ncbi:Hypothetical protein (Fragment) [Durusdinium trenchii]|uniref:Uncharacterized protein n=1 Tax=Durusdinium trenchii TaxID=1381693 RepID=A0ABP0KUS7_9DINO
MGASSSLDRVAQSQVGWTLPHQTGSNAWTNYVMSRYGIGYSVTGVSASLALPRLLRRRMQDWVVENLAFYFGRDFLSFGRNLQSLSREGSAMFYGVDIRLGTHESSWFYCKSTEWLLQLHKAVLEPLHGQLENGGDHRFPGRAYYLGDEPPPAAVAVNGSRAANRPAKKPDSGEGQTDEAKDSSSHQGQSCDREQTSESFTHQLCIFLGNADGHVGLLTLPIPDNKVQELAPVLEIWKEYEAPCIRAGQTWTSEEDFLRLREEHVNLPDLLLLALEPDVAMSLTPDWTWEKYPRGYGEVALPLSGHPDGDEPLIVSSTSNSSIGSDT